MRYVWYVLLWLSVLAAHSEAAITHQKTSTQGSCSNASSCTTSFASLPSAGNSVFVMIACWNNAADCNITSITDNQSNSYTYTCQTDTFGNSQVCIGYDLSIGSPSGTFTVTANAAASTYFEVVATEYTPLAALDVTKGASYAALSTADTGVSASTAQASELSVCAASIAAGDTNINITTPTGYTRRGVQQNATVTIGFEASDKILSSTGTQQCAWSHDLTLFAGWGALLMTFTESSGSSSFGPLRRRAQ